MVDGAVALLPEPGAVLADDQPGVGIDVRCPVDPAAVGLERIGAKGEATELIRLPALRVRERAHLVAEPAEVVVDGGADHRVVRLGRRELGIAPVRGELPHQARVIGLTHQGQVSRWQRPDDHLASLPVSSPEYTNSQPSALTTQNSVLSTQYFALSTAA